MTSKLVKSGCASVLKGVELLREPFRNRVSFDFCPFVYFFIFSPDFYLARVGVYPAAETPFVVSTILLVGICMMFRQTGCQNRPMLGLFSISLWVKFKLYWRCVVFFLYSKTHQGSLISPDLYFSVSFLVYLVYIRKYIVFNFLQFV